MDLNFESEDYDEMKIKIITNSSFSILAEHASDLTGNKIEPTPSNDTLEKPKESEM